CRPMQQRLRRRRDSPVGGIWWVLRGSNSRPTPCKGAALPAELSTRSYEKPRALRSTQLYQKSVDRILERLAGAELRHLGGADADRFPGAGIATAARDALADGEGAEADESDRAAL